MTFQRIMAQKGAVRVLTHAVETGRLANAYLFEGPSGVGKSMAAVALARAVLCPTRPEQGCGECDVCRRIGNGNHPDLRFFRPREDGNRNIQVETLRQDILPVAQFAPFEGEHAFLVFPEADVSFPEVHPESANALLKTLEEPKRGVTFVLTSERPERLLPTIRSRCQSVRSRACRRASSSGSSSPTACPRTRAERRSRSRTAARTGPSRSRPTAPERRSSRWRSASTAASRARSRAPSSTSRRR